MSLDVFYQVNVVQSQQDSPLGHTAIRHPIHGTMLYRLICTRCNKCLCKFLKTKFLFIAISGICLGIFEGSHGSHRAAPEPMCLPTTTRAGHERATQCIRLVHAYALTHCGTEADTELVLLWCEGLFCCSGSRCSVSSLMRQSSWDWLPLQTQHPGFYFQQAANHAINRKLAKCMQPARVSVKFIFCHPRCDKVALEFVVTVVSFCHCLHQLLTLKVLNFWKITSYCSLKPLWSGMGEVVPARTLPTLHPPSPPTASIVVTSTLRVKPLWVLFMWKVVINKSFIWAEIWCVCMHFSIYIFCHMQYSFAVGNPDVITSGSVITFVVTLHL